MKARSRFQSTYQKPVGTSSSNSESSMCLTVLTHCLLLSGLSVVLGLSLRVTSLGLFDTIFAAVVN